MTTKQVKESALNYLHWFNTIAQEGACLTSDVPSQYVAANICFYLNGDLLADSKTTYHDEDQISLLDWVKSL